MELYQQIICKGLDKGELRIALSEQAERWLEGECLRTLKEIRNVLLDETLNDRECFWRIERIIEIFERIGIDCGSHHDFG